MHLVEEVVLTLLRSHKLVTEGVVLLTANTVGQTGDLVAAVGGVHEQEVPRFRGRHPVVDQGALHLRHKIVTREGMLPMLGSI